MAGMLTVEPSEEEYKQAASATHDQVRLQAVGLINMVFNASGSDCQQVGAALPQEMVMEELCSRVAKLQHKAPMHSAIYDYTFSTHVASTEEWGPSTKSKVPSRSSMYDEATAFASWKPFFPSKDPSASSADADTVPVSCHYEEMTDPISTSDTAPVSCHDGETMEIDPISSSDNAPAPCHDADSMQTDTLSFPKTATGLFRDVDTTSMDDSSSFDNIVLGNAKPISCTSIPTTSPTLSSPKLWSSITAEIGAVSRFATASSTPISRNTPISSPASSSTHLWSSIKAKIGAGLRLATASITSISPSTPVSKPTKAIIFKTLPFGILDNSGTITALFSDVDTSQMGDSDDEDSAMSGDEDVEVFDVSVPVNHTGPTIATVSSQ